MIFRFFSGSVTPARSARNLSPARTPMTLQSHRLVRAQHRLRIRLCASRPISTKMQTNWFFPTALCSSIGRHRRIDAAGEAQQYHLSPCRVLSLQFADGRFDERVRRPVLLAAAADIHDESVSAAGSLRSNGTLLGETGCPRSVRLRSGRRRPERCPVLAMMR